MTQVAFEPPADLSEAGNTVLLCGLKTRISHISSQGREETVEVSPLLNPGCDPII